jgi:AcrR family transcriptional regulator
MKLASAQDLSDRVAAADQPTGNGSRGGTRERIIASAITLFAERGFDVVSVREITTHANANAAAISYYFGAKEQLIAHAIRSVVAPLNRNRLAALDAVQEAAGTKRLKLENVVRAMVEPTVSACKHGAGYERYYARILTLSFALRQPFVDLVMFQESSLVAARFIDAFARALPGMSRTEVCWRYDFLMGALIHILLDSARAHQLKRVSGDLCDTDDAVAITDQLVSFVVSGMQAPPPTGRNGKGKLCSPARRN